MIQFRVCFHGKIRALLTRVLLLLVYSNAIQENMNALLYPGFIEELVDIVELQDDKIVVSCVSHCVESKQYIGCIAVRLHSTVGSRSDNKIPARPHNFPGD